MMAEDTLPAKTANVALKGGNQWPKPVFAVLNARKQWKRATFLMLGETEQRKLSGRMDAPSVNAFSAA
jgi:hypothetical protein